MKTSIKHVDLLNPIYFSPDKLGYFKFPFPGIQYLECNFSQLHQDLFVLSVLNGMQGGYYLDIGASYPLHLSNSFLLESRFSWAGICIELDSAKANKHRLYRTNPCFNLDALEVSYANFLRTYGAPRTIDYLSVDIDPARFSLQALSSVLQDPSFQFRVITFEHDFYNGGLVERAASRQLLSDLGYRLVLPNVSWGSFSIEDWWVNPNLVPRDRLNLMEMTDFSCNYNVHEYFYTCYSI